MHTVETKEGGFFSAKKNRIFEVLPFYLNFGVCLGLIVCKVSVLLVSFNSIGVRMVCLFDCCVYIFLYRVYCGAIEYTGGSRTVVS